MAHSAPATTASATTVHLLQQWRACYNNGVRLLQQQRTPATTKQGENTSDNKPKNSKTGVTTTGATTA